MSTPKKQKTVPRPIKLCDVPDVFGSHEFCAIFQISPSHFYVLKRHSALPVRPLKLKSHAIRFAKADVVAYLEAGPSRRSA